LQAEAAIAGDTLLNDRNESGIAYLGDGRECPCRSQVSFGSASPYAGATRVQNSSKSLASKKAIALMTFPSFVDAKGALSHAYA
jgi:hypothetical protein